MRILAVIVLSIACRLVSGAQESAVPDDSVGFDRRCDVPPFVSAIAPLVIPKIFQDVYSLKEYILGDEFAGFRRRHGDRRAVDALFVRAMRLSWDNRFEALLISLFAVMDHRVLGFRLPVVGALVWIPLTLEFRDDFDGRYRRLPSALYPDSPPEGDRDKLQHFFGSALLTYVTESPEAADRIGESIEKGEELFIQGGVNDPRDVRANRQGQRFGTALLLDLTALPGEFFLKATP